MTFLHFTNCIALTFIPPWIVYKSKLEDYATVPMGVQAAVIYGATQLVQMILTATFVPSSDPDRPFDVAQEFMKAFISLADLLGLHYLFQQKKTAHGAAAIGLFWAATESLFHRLVPFWIEARSQQFSWHHTFTSIEANLGLVTHMCFALLVWMWLRRPQLRKNIAVTIAVQRFVFPVVSSYLRHSVTAFPVVAVAAHAVMSFIFAGVTWSLFSQLDQRSQ